MRTLDLRVAPGLPAKAVDLTEAETHALADILGGDEQIEGPGARMSASMPAPVSMTASDR